jgi:sugar-specific transcriptional regulator TrmB
VSAFEELQALGFSEYEAKAYVALLKKSPVTGYELSRLSGVPRSMIYEVLDKLVLRGAAVSSPEEDVTRYAPVPADTLLDRLRHQYEDMIDHAQHELATMSREADIDYVWSIKGYDNVMAHARAMIQAAQGRIHVGLLPVTFPDLEALLTEASIRGVQVRINTTGQLDFPAGRVAVTPLAMDDVGQFGTPGMILVRDGEELLICEELSAPGAHASWTRSPLLAFLAEHHMRLDSYIPQIFEMLGEQLWTILDDQDRSILAPLLKGTAG